MHEEDDHKRFTRLFLQHESEILRSVIVFVPNRTDAREIVQETAVALWKRFDDYDVTRPFINWACGFARIEVRRFLRKTHRRPTISGHAFEQLAVTAREMETELDERILHLRECLKRLSEDQRGLILGYYFEEQTVESLLNGRYGSVESIYKSLQRVRRLLFDCVRRKIGHTGT